VHAPACGLGGLRPSTRCFLRLTLDVEREFLVEFVLDAAASHERANAQQKVLDAHGHASFITRLSGRRSETSCRA
jgi:hypothetical protein